MFVSTKDVRACCSQKLQTSLDIVGNFHNTVNTHNANLHAVPVVFKFEIASWSSIFDLHARVVSELSLGVDVLAAQAELSQCLNIVTNANGYSDLQYN